MRLKFVDPQNLLFDNQVARDWDGVGPSCADCDVAETAGDKKSGRSVDDQMVAAWLHGQPWLRSHLKPKDIQVAYRHLVRGESIRIIAREFGLNPGTVSRKVTKFTTLSRIHNTALLACKLLADNDMCLVDPDAQQKSIIGYAVSKLGRARLLHAAPTSDQIASYLWTNRGDLHIAQSNTAQYRLHLAVSKISDGAYLLDLKYVVPTLADAFALAVLDRQPAIYDCEKRIDIPVGHAD